MAKKSSVITSFAVEPELEPTVESTPPRVNHHKTKRAEPAEVPMKQLAFRIPEAKHTAWKDFVFARPTKQNAASNDRNGGRRLYQAPYCEALSRPRSSRIW